MTVRGYATHLPGAFCLPTRTRRSGDRRARGIRGLRAAERHAKELNLVNAEIDAQSAAPAGSRFDGIHMDIDLYVLPGWQDVTRRESLLRNLLELSTAIKASAAANGLAFGVDIPFWWHAPDPETGQAAIGAVTANESRKPAS